jgi:alkyl sulfatase BDS1-like metallo-beta-lactamase superfamily hydrolase
MATDLLALSARFVDTGVDDGPGSTNRMTTELSEVADGIAVIEAFSHVVVIRTADGLVVADTSAAAFGPAVVASMRAWSPDEPVSTILYTHGHVDHVGGARAFVDDAASRGHAPPAVVAHEAVVPRFDRYDLTNGYNAVVNHRQFGGRGEPSWFSDWVVPGTTFRESLSLSVGGVDFDLQHALGETDDHLWAWLPSYDAVLGGDFLTWVFPNAGNPQKVQRFPREWAVALRSMAAKRPSLFLPAHGLPIGGADRIALVLDEAASALEFLVSSTLEMMNSGARLDDIVQAVRLPAEVLERPYLKPIYDEPEFVVRNIWRLYGGWYDGNPARLKPAPDAVVASEVAALAGGVDRLVERAESVVGSSPHLAAQLVEWAAQASPASASVHAARARVYSAVRAGELSLMARGIYGAAARESGQNGGHEPRDREDR